MKQWLLIAPLLVSACAVKKVNSKAVSSPKATAAVGQTFEGVLPGSLDCKGVRTEITLFEPARRFKMKETCLGNAAGDLVEESRGEWALVKGQGKNAQATVIELTSEKFEQERYFLRVDNSALRALDDQGKEISTTENATLRQVKR